MTTRGSWRVRANLGIRAAAGLALAFGAVPLVRAVDGPRADRGGEIAARVLGARHLVEAACLSRGSGPLLAKGIITVNLLHGTSMAGLAAASPRRRRLALAALAEAAVFAVLDALTLPTD